jgi:Holliday junction resolvasome RuvABC endonuclease subunit
MRVVGIDPGLGHLGVVLADVDQDQVRFVRSLAYETEKQPKKRNVRATADNTDRLRIQIARLLEDVFCDPMPVLLCAESLSFPRNAASSAKIAMMWGGIVALCETAQVGIIEASPQEIKRWVTGATSAPKEVVRARVEALCPELVNLWPLGPRGGESLIEHAADAAAALLAGLHDPTALALRRQLG